VHQSGNSPAYNLPAGQSAKRSARPPTSATPAVQRWLSPAAAALLLLAAAEFDVEDRAVVERIVPPWMRQARRRAERDRAIWKLVPFYVDPVPTSGRALAKAIAAHCQQPPPPGDPRRPLIDDVLANSPGRRAPDFETVRQALAGVPPRGG